MQFKPEQPGLRAGEGIGAQNLIGQRDNTLGADRLDAQIERARLARRIDAGLDQADIFLEDRVLVSDAQRQDTVEPAVNRR